jgi:hypothetical protein
MQQAASLGELMIAGFSGAAIVTCGGLYALFFAWSRLRPGNLWGRLSGFSFLGLALSLALLAWSLHFDGLWRAVAAFLLTAYLVAPWLIWRLVRATHGGEGITVIQPDEGRA